MFCVIMLSVPATDRELAARLAITAVFGLAWPHLAYWAATRPGASPEWERRNVLFDALLGGVVAAALDFRLWPLAAILSAGFINGLSFAGPRFLPQPLAIFGLGACVFASVTGFNVHLETEPIATALSFATILCYAGVIAGTSYRLRLRQRETRAALEREERRSYELLANVFPEPVIPRLRAGETPIADQFADVTVVFIDMVEFTPMAERLGPRRTVTLLNELFGRFDEAAREHRVEKIETTGDGYLAVAGAPDPLDDHPAAAAQFALAAIEAALAASAATSESVEIRVGIHTGPVYGGVIGESRFHYKIFGETVNTASRVQGHSWPGRALVSESTYKRLRPSHILEEHALVELKGHGPMRTYWLIGRGERR